MDPIVIGNYHLPNRMIMAPMTRGRAETGYIPNNIMAEYYSMRSQAGLIVTEATAISPQGYGWLNAPGIWNQEQVAGWKLITNAVHANNGRIFLQLWHMGRVSHPDFLNGDIPVAPSEIAANGETHTPSGKKNYVTPRALTIAEIHSTIQNYATAAQLAIEAGFDGVEIHAANGYLIDQFIRDCSNQRTDEYGGNIEKRLRFLTEVCDAVCEEIGANKVGVRLSPTNHYNDMKDSNPVATFSAAALALNQFELAYLHIMEALPGHMLAAEGERVLPYIRKEYNGILIANGGYDKALANAALAKNEADAIAFGTTFLANPDLVKRFKIDAKLNDPDYATLYTHGAKGYTDYPVLEG